RSSEAATRWRSGRTWSTLTVSPPATRASCASPASSAAPRPPRRTPSSRRRRARKAKSTTATAPWSATPRRGSTGARGSSSSSWADARIHGTTKRQVAAMFAEERPHLHALPPTPFRYYAFGTRTVHPDGCVEVAKAYYRVPPGRIGHDVSVQWDERRVRILDPQ